MITFKLTSVRRHRNYYFSLLNMISNIIVIVRNNVIKHIDARMDYRVESSLKFSPQTQTDKISSIVAPMIVQYGIYN